MVVKAVIFDMDGTLIEAKQWHYEALNEALEIFGESISPEEHSNEFDGLPTRRKLEMLAEKRGFPRHLFGIVSEIKQERTLRHIAKSCFPRIEQLLMFQWLKENAYLVAVATNSIRKTAEVMLTSAGIWDYLDVVLTNEDVVLPKPDPEIYVATARQLGVAPQECLVVEDNDFGVASAIAAGCEVLRVDGVIDVRLKAVQDAL